MTSDTPKEPAPAKRISAAPLPEFHDELFTLWAWAKRRSRSALATHTLEARIEANAEQIREMIQNAANNRGISYEEMRAKILANPKYGWTEETKDADE